MSSTTNTTVSASGSTSPTSGDILAVTALVISIVALVTTVLQVLQQYLASAEGFRRCAPSVMELWSKGTHRRFRWRELRFEVVFETPVLFVAFPGNVRGPIDKRLIYDVDGTDKSYNDTYTLKPKPNDGSNVSTAYDEKASWVTLLEVIQREEKDSREWAKKNFVSQNRKAYREPEHTILYQLQKKTRSYDFIPSGVTKPFATTTISHLIETVGMLGMFWKSLDIAGGNIQAEGNGYMLTSTRINGLGLMTSFSVTGASKFDDTRIIPSYAVKEFVFGFVRSILDRSLDDDNLELMKKTPNMVKKVPALDGDHEQIKSTIEWMRDSPDFSINKLDRMRKTLAMMKYLPVLDVGTLERTKKTLAMMKCLPATIDAYKSHNERASMFSVTFEIIGMLAEPVRIRSSNFRMLPNPTADRWLGSKSEENLIGWDINWVNAMKAFKANLDLSYPHLPELTVAEDNPDLPTQVTTTETDPSSLVQVTMKGLDDIVRVLKAHLDLDMREALHDGLDITRYYLRNLRSDKQSALLDITGVVASHVTAVTTASGEIQSSMDTSNDQALTLIELYFKVILSKVEGDEKFPAELKSRRKAIWIALVFRMICWFLLHDFNKADVNMMPPDMKDSRMPVFIG